MIIENEDVERLARMAGLKIDPAHLPGVVRNFDILMMQAATLMSPPIDALIEPAAVFCP